MVRFNFLRFFILCLPKKDRYLILTVRTIFTCTKIRVKILRVFCRDYHPFKDDLICVVQTQRIPKRRDYYEHWILNNTSEWLKLNETIAYDKIYWCSTCTVNEVVLVFWHCYSIFPTYLACINFYRESTIPIVYVHRLVIKSNQNLSF